MLHHRHRADFTIQVSDDALCLDNLFFISLTLLKKMKHAQLKALRRCRVIFSCIHDMLAVYIPGHFLKLIDCGLEHEPWDFLTFKGEDVPHLPHFVMRSPSNANLTTTAFEMGVPISMGRNNCNSGYVILNLRRGHIHEFQFAYDPLIQWLERQRRSDQFVQMIHLALAHIEDETFTTRV